MFAKTSTLIILTLVGAFALSVCADKGYPNAILLRQSIKDSTGFDLAMLTDTKGGDPHIDMRQRVLNKLKEAKTAAKGAPDPVRLAAATGNEPATAEGAVDWDLYATNDKMTDKSKTTAEGSVTANGLTVQAVASCTALGIEISLSTFSGTTPEPLNKHGDNLSDLTIRADQRAAFFRGGVLTYENQVALAFTGKTREKSTDADYADVFHSTQRTMLSPGTAAQMLALRRLLVQLTTKGGGSVVVDLNPQNSQMQIFSATCLTQ